MVDPDPSCRTSIKGVKVPLHRDGTARLVPVERELVEVVLRGRTHRSDRALRWDVLDVVLEKLSTGRSWKSSTTDLKTVSQSDAVRAFQHWYADGRLGKILKILEEVRALEGGSKLGAGGVSRGSPVLLRDAPLARPLEDKRLRNMVRPVPEAGYSGCRLAA